MDADSAIVPKFDRASCPGEGHCSSLRMSELFDTVHVLSLGRIQHVQIIEELIVGTINSRPLTHTYQLLLSLRLRALSGQLLLWRHKLIMVSIFSRRSLI